MKKILLGIILHIASPCAKVSAAGQLVTESRVDIFGNGAKERVRFLLVEGQRLFSRENYRP